MRRVFPILLMCVILSCSHQNKLPDDVLPPAKMQAVLWDMLRADQFSSNFIVEKDTVLKRMKNIRLYQQVFAIHHIDKETFKRSLAYYQAHAELMHQIADSISQMTLAPTATVRIDSTTHADSASHIIPDTNKRLGADTLTKRKLLKKPVPVN